ncbi:MAG: DUF3524 domain-containing protein [Planctomycetes bacterium]|nr:DUF3524 domain-containing protein [Planctomycetota bacterium]
MKILALEPYYGGSHKAFIDGWSNLSKHSWTLLELAPYKWKWRMRHSAITFANQLSQYVTKGKKWDLIFCSDMLNLAEFLGLAPKTIKNLPAIVYFHENQLTYPVQLESERDYQFAMTNITTALAAKSVWFNSAFHRDSFLNALTVFLAKMPDHQPTDAVKKIKNKSLIYPPGVNDISKRQSRKPGPMRILWAARWEHDKNPEDFFEALKIIKIKGTNFRLSVIGEQFRETPDIFAWAKSYFTEHIDRWGYQPTRDEYEQALTETDIFVSTANHEFFGISVVEAVLAGAYPVLPKRLAYPEILKLEQDSTEKFFYDGSVTALADKLTQLAKHVEKNCLWNDNSDHLTELMQQYKWNNLAAVLDQAIEKIKNSS